MATVRRVRRIIRKIDPWTTLKVSAVIWAVLALAFVLGAVIFWAVLERAGVPDRLVDFMVEITLIEEGAAPFANTEQFLRFLIFGSVVGWVLMTGVSVAVSVIYNLVSDVVGGLEIVVLEETLNPVAVPSQQVLHPPNDYRAVNGGVIPPGEQADLPTEEVQPVSQPEEEPAESEPAETERSETEPAESERSDSEPERVEKIG